MNLYCDTPNSVAGLTDVKKSKNSTTKNLIYKNDTYYKYGTQITKNDHLSWRISCFFKTLVLSLFFPAVIISKDYRKLISRSWKECKNGEERVSIYVKTYVKIN